MKENEIKKCDDDDDASENLPDLRKWMIFFWHLASGI